MGAYILRRLLSLIPIIIGISLVAFAVMNLAPGDFLTALRMNPDNSPETIEQMRASFGLDRPLYEQYFRWFFQLLRGNFGYSFTYRAPVSFLIRTRMYNTLLLSITSMIVSWLLAIPIGVISAVKKYSFTDGVLTIFAFVGISAPSFFVALLLLYFVATTRFMNLPIGGMTSIGFDWMTFPEKIVDLARHLVIPTIVLGFGGVAGLMRQMRGNLLEVLRQDYVTTARSKGLSEGKVIWKHAVRNAINPLITIFGFQLGGLLSGAALTETIIAWPGMGQMMLEAVQRKDIYLAMGNMVMGAALLIIGNLIADVLLAVSDPRIRYQ